MLKEFIIPPFNPAFQQINFSLTGNANVQLAAAPAGQRVYVYSLILTTDTPAQFTIRSGANTIIAPWLDSYSGLPWPNHNIPWFVGNPGEGIFIQPSAASLTASGLLIYRIQD